MQMKKQKITFITIGILGILIGLMIVLSANTKIESFKALAGYRLVPPKEAISLQDSFIAVAESVSPVVVNISTEQILKYRYPGYDYGDFFDRFFDGSSRRTKERYFKRQGLGTGLIVSEDGFVLTNYHVVSDVSKISVVLSDKTEYQAEPVAVDKTHDLALIKFSPKRKVPKAVLADSDKVRVGEWAIAIGNPFGYDHTVTAGIVSAKGRHYQSSEGGDMPNLIQTDAAINPGNSGGPLANIRGEVIGINTFIVSTSGSYAGIGFAVPINDAILLLEEVGKVTKPALQSEPLAIFDLSTLGFKVSEISGKLKEKLNLKNGVIVTSVADRSPAKKSGLTAGDVIVALNGKKVDKASEFGAFKSPLKITVLRNNKEVDIIVSGGLADSNLFGLTAEELTAETVKKYSLAVNAGVLVLAVREDSEADVAGISAGDVIIEIDKKQIRNLTDYTNALKSASLKEGVLFVVNRRGAAYYVVISRQE